MAQDQAKQFLVQGINAARAGQKDQARQLFQNALRLDPQNETAWLWMSSVAKDNRERLFCLQNLIQINPQNEMAIKGLQALGVDPNQARQQAAAQAQAASTPAQAGDVPQIGREYLNQIAPAVDQFVSNYRPLPPGGSEVIAPKSGRLYGEAAAIRRNLVRTWGLVAAGLVGLLLVLGLVYAVLSSGGQEGGQEVVDRPTLTPSFTATFTPTVTPGATETPFPEEFASYTPFPEFEIAEGLPAGDPFAVTATPIAHDIAPAVGRNRLVEQVAILNDPDTETAGLEWFTNEQTAAGFNCYPELYYYPITALASTRERRNLEDAEAIYNAADENPECRQSSNAFLIDAAACYLYYRYGEVTGDEQYYTTAEGFCQQSLNARQEADLPAYPLAADIMARLDLRNGEEQSAISLLDTAIRFNSTDADLLLTRAEISLAQNDPGNALRFITQALYLNPILEPALALRVQAYLQQAAIESDEDLQTVKYGTAVQATKDYLLWYPGSARAYLLLAQARLGEGNVLEAEDALNRIIQAGDSLPSEDREVVRGAYALRAQLFENSARYQEALEDVQFLLQSAPEDTDLLQRQLQLAFLIGEYPLAAQTLDSLLEAAPEDTELLLLNLRLRTVTCQFIDEVDCDYRLAFSLSDDFIETLPDEVQPEMLTYRAIARYQLTQAATEMANNERENEFEQALEDLQAAMETRQSGLEFYYLGLLQEALEEPAAALRAYTWAAYWSQLYDYPFAEALQERIEAVQEALADAA